MAKEVRFTVATKFGPVTGTLIHNRKLAILGGLIVYRGRSYQVYVYLFQWDNGQWEIDEEKHAHGSEIYRIYHCCLLGGLTDLGVKTVVPEIKRAFRQWIVSPDGNAALHQQWIFDLKDDITTLETDLAELQRQVEEKTKRLEAARHELERIDTDTEQSAS